MCEGYVRDKIDLSHAEIPLYKGNSSDDGRDEGFFIVCLTRDCVIKMRTEAMQLQSARILIRITQSTSIYTFS